MYSKEKEFKINDDWIKDRWKEFLKNRGNSKSDKNFKKELKKIFKKIHRSYLLPFEKE